MKPHIIGGFGSAGAGNRTGRKINTRAGLDTNARERVRRQVRSDDDSNPTPPTVDEVKEAIRLRVCWICGRTGNRDGKPFSELVYHLVGGHGLNLNVLRDEMGVTKRFKFISDEMRSRQSERGKLNYDPVRLDGRKQRGKKHVYSLAGRAVHMAKQWHITKDSQRMATEAARSKAISLRGMRETVCSMCGVLFRQRWVGKGHARRRTCSDTCESLRKKKSIEDRFANGWVPKKRQPLPPIFKPCIVCGTVLELSGSKRKRTTCGSTLCISKLSQAALATEEVRAKQLAGCARRKPRKQSAEERLKRSLKRHTPESKAKMAEAARAVWERRRAAESDHV